MLNRTREDDLALRDGIPPGTICLAKDPRGKLPTCRVRVISWAFRTHNAVGIKDDFSGPGTKTHSAYVQQVEYLDRDMSHMTQEVRGLVCRLGQLHPLENQDA